MSPGCRHSSFLTSLPLTKRKRGIDLPNQPPLWGEGLNIRWLDSAEPRWLHGNCPQSFSILQKFRGENNFSVILPAPPHDHIKRLSLRYMMAHFEQVAAHQSRNWAQGLKVSSVAVNGRMEGVHLVCRCSKNHQKQTSSKNTVGKQWVNPKREFL